MSRQKVVVGHDGQGRPITRWDGPDRVELPTVPPGPIERRLLTDQEAAERAARVADPRLRAREAIQARAERLERPKEGSTMPETIEPTPYELLESAARQAHEAQEAVTVAEQDLAEARARLLSAQDELRRHYLATLPSKSERTRGRRPNGDTGSVALDGETLVVADSGPKYSKTIPVTEPKPKRQPGRHPSKADEAREKAERAAKVVAAMGRHGGDQRAVAAELGMRANAVAMVVKHARIRGELP